MGKKPRHRPTRLAVIGTGMRGEQHIRSFLDERHNGMVEIVMLYDPNSSRLTRASKIVASLQGTEPVTLLDPRHMYRARGIDAVLITSPDYTHSVHTMAMLRNPNSALRVIVEKPVATTYTDTRNIAEMLASQGRNIQTCFEMRYCPKFVRLREIVENEIGKIRRIECIDHKAIFTYALRWHLQKIPEEELRMLRRRTGATLFHPEMERKSGGLLMQKSVHTFDLLNWMLGIFPHTVHATGGNKLFGGYLPDDITCGGYFDHIGSALVQVPLCGHMDTCQFGLPIKGDDAERYITREDSYRARHCVLRDELYGVIDTVHVWLGFRPEGYSHDIKVDYRWENIPLDKRPSQEDPDELEITYRRTRDNPYGLAEYRVMNIIGDKRTLQFNAAKEDAVLVSTKRRKMTRRRIKIPPLGDLQYTEADKGLIDRIVNGFFLTGEPSIGYGAGALAVATAEAAYRSIFRGGEVHLDENEFPGIETLRNLTT